MAHRIPLAMQQLSSEYIFMQLASCLIYARALLEYVTIIVWFRFVINMLRSMKFTEDKVLTFLILCEKMLK